jgi:hypothetical protein
MSTYPIDGTEVGAPLPAEAGGPAGTAVRGLFRAPQAHLRQLERALERGLSLEHGANVFPLLHVLGYYLVLVTLAGRWLTSPWLVAPLWVALVLLNYSLTIGILHLHAHRKLFTR